MVSIGRDKLKLCIRQDIILSVSLSMFSLTFNNILSYRRSIDLSIPLPIRFLRSLFFYFLLNALYISIFHQLFDHSYYPYPHTSANNFFVPCHNLNPLFQTPNVFFSSSLSISFTRFITQLGYRKKCVKERKI